MINFAFGLIVACKKKHFKRRRAFNMGLKLKLTVTCEPADNLIQFRNSSALSLNFCHIRVGKFYKRPSPLFAHLALGLFSLQSSSLWLRHWYPAKVLLRSLYPTHFNLLMPSVFTNTSAFISKTMTKVELVSFLIFSINS